MRYLLFLLLLLPAHSEPLPWHTSYQEAVRVARVQHKPILLLQLFGRLDEELC